MKFLNPATGEELEVRQGVVLFPRYFSGTEESNLDVGVVQRVGSNYFIRNRNGGLFTIFSSEGDLVYVPLGLRGKIHSGDSIHRGKYYIKVISGKIK